MDFIWSIFLMGTLCLFMYSLILYKRLLIKYFLIGAFLLVFDFIVETIGGMLGLWSSTGSLLLIGYVPIEVMGMCLFGGTAWAIQLDNRIKRKERFLYFLLICSIFGVTGEQILIACNVMSYSGWWNIYYAWFAYILTTVLLIFLVKKCLKGVKDT